MYDCFDDEDDDDDDDDDNDDDDDDEDDDETNKIWNRMTMMMIKTQHFHQVYNTAKHWIKT